MPIVIAMITYLIWQQLGIAAFAGILFMTVQIIPTQGQKIIIKIYIFDFITKR